MHKQELIKQYEEGYRKIPEQTKAMKTLEKAQMEVLTPKEKYKT